MTIIMHEKDSIPVKAGTNVLITRIGNTYQFEYLDLSGRVQSVPIIDVAWIDDRTSITGKIPK